MSLSKFLAKYLASQTEITPSKYIPASKSMQKNNNKKKGTKINKNLTKYHTFLKKNVKKMQKNRCFPCEYIHTYTHTDTHTHTSTMFNMYQPASIQNIRIKGTGSAMPLHSKIM